MRPTKIALLAALASLLASPVNAGLILTVEHVDLDPGFEELLVWMQVTGDEGVSSIGYDLAFEGTGVEAFNLTINVVGGTPTCPTPSIGPVGSLPCVLSELGPPYPDGTRYNLVTLGSGIFDGTYAIGYQLIELGTGFRLDASIENLVAFDDAGNAITDITLRPLVPEPSTAALVGLGLLGLATRRRIETVRARADPRA